MTWWPGWDSVANTGWWSRFWFWFGIACLFALGASEVVSHVYGLRKDELVAAAERAATEQRQRDADAAEARRKLEVEAVQKKLSEADQKVADLQKSATHRRLTETQKQTLVAALAPFAGQKVTVPTVMGSDDGLAFAGDFIDAFRAARWAVDPGSPGQAVYDKPPLGLEPTMNQEEAEANRVPPAFIALQQTLANLGLIPPQAAFIHPSVPKDTIEMRIRLRPGLNR